MPIDTSVSIDADRCRAFFSAAWWSGHAAHVATGSANATSTHCQLGNRLAGILVLTIPGQPAVVTHWLAPGPRNPEGLRPASGRTPSR